MTWPESTTCTKKFCFSRALELCFALGHLNMEKNIGGNEIEPRAIGVAAWYNEFAPRWGN
jgi:hypothetical protein